MGRRLVILGEPGAGKTIPLMLNTMAAVTLGQPETALGLSLPLAEMKQRCAMRCWNGMCPNGCVRKRTRSTAMSARRRRGWPGWRAPWCVKARATSTPSLCSSVG
jgi:hypothetical protein